MKRFSDTEKWDDRFFCEMPDVFKLFYLFLLDKCDNVGVWKVNKPLVEFFIGELDWNEFLNYMGDRIFFIVEFPK